MSDYENSHGHYSRGHYEDELGYAPAYGPGWLCRAYGPVSRFCLETLPERVDNWLRAKDESLDALLDHSPNVHKTMPKAMILQNSAGAMRSLQRMGMMPVLQMAAGFAGVAALATVLGAGLVVAGIIALVALPVSTAAGALALTAAGGALRAVIEVPRALINLPVAYARRREYYDDIKQKEDAAHAEEKKTLHGLCRVLHDDERAATQAAPGDRANWLCALAKQFPDDFLEAAQKAKSREAAPALKSPGPSVSDAGGTCLP